MNGAQALIESLLREQVDHIFGYAGATICPVVDVLKDDVTGGNESLQIPLMLLPPFCIPSPK